MCSGGELLITILEFLLANPFHTKRLVWKTSRPCGTLVYNCRVSGGKEEEIRMANVDTAWALP